MQISENIFHKLISNTINENEINKLRFNNLDNNYSKVCLSILLQTFTNHPDANLTSEFLKNNNIEKGFILHDQKMIEYDDVYLALKDCNKLLTKNVNK